MIPNPIVDSVEAFPNISEMKEFVPSGSGYLQGGLQRENWERATLAIVKMTSELSIHPGINFLIKHAGAIFKHLFTVAMKDIKLQDVKMGRLLDISPGLEGRLSDEFDKVLWDLMQNASDKMHVSTKSWYSCLDPNLPGFQPLEDEAEEDVYQLEAGGEFVKTPSRKQVQQEKQKEGLLNRFASLFSLKTVDDTTAKNILRDRAIQKAGERKRFLAEERTAMMNDAETDKVILSAFHYVIALHEQIHTYLNFQINDFLYNEFKNQVENFPREMVSDKIDFGALCPPNKSLDDEIVSLEAKMRGIDESLSDVNNIQSQMV